MQMAGIDSGMSILDLLIMAKTRPRPENPPYFVSTQVAEARRYFLDLTRRPALDSSLCAAVANECGRTTWSTGAASLSLSWSFVAEGAGSVELSGRRYRLQAGVTFAYGPGVPHTIRTDPDRPMLKYYLVFKGVEGKRLLDESPLHGWLAVQISSPKEVVELLEILQREGAGQGGYGARIRTALPLSGKETDTCKAAFLFFGRRQWQTFRPT